MTLIQRYGIDVGERRIGIAKQVNDSSVVVPLDTVFLTGDETGVEEVKQLIEEDVAVSLHNPSQLELVVGLPLLMSGTYGHQARSVVSWAQQMSRLCPHVSLRLVDERLSSVTAHRFLRESGKKTTSHRSYVDQQAAMTILEHALSCLESGKKIPGKSLEEVREEIDAEEKDHHD